MNIVLRIINENLDLKNQKVLVYLKPQTNNADWESAAWQACSPQSGGGSYILDAITNEIGAYIESKGGREQSAYQKIDPKTIAVITQEGNELVFNPAQLNSDDAYRLTNTQSGIKNTTTYPDVFPVWCVNKKTTCRPINPMYNPGFSTFELLEKAYFTIGSSTSTDTFKVQNWDELSEIDLPSNLVSADIRAKLDEATNNVTFTMENPQYV